MRIRRNERGALSNRGIGFGLAGLALVACGMGTIPGHGGTSTTSPTTTTIGTTTTTVPGATTTASSAPTTTTTVAPTTTTTVSGTDPCASENASTAALGRWPCLVNTGPHITFTVGVNVAANNGTSCTLCPAGLTWTAGGGYRINSCVAIDGWKITGDLQVWATNGDKNLHRTEAATKAAACVKLTHVLIAPPEPGSDGEVGLSTGFTGGDHGAPSCTFNAVQTPCGSVYFADSEVSMAQPRTGFNYALSDTNLHLWRDYIHGGPQGIDSDGYSEVHDSYLRADRSEAAMNGKAHGDAYFQNGGTGEWMFVDHNKLFCGAQEIDCNRDGAYVNDDTDTGGTVSNNLYMASAGVFFCASTGVDQSGPKPAHPFGSNIFFKNNVFELGAGTPCQHNNAVDDFNKATALSHNDHWCNNRMSDGSLVNAALETGGCP